MTDCYEMTQAMVNTIIFGFLASGFVIGFLVAIPCVLRFVYVKGNQWLKEQSRE